MIEGLLWQPGWVGARPPLLGWGVVRLGSWWDKRRLSLSIFRGTYAHMFLEIFAQEALVREVELLCYLLNALGGVLEKVANLEHHVAVDRKSTRLNSSHA